MTRGGVEQRPRSQIREERPHVRVDARAVRGVARGQLVDDRLDRARAVAQGHDGGGGRAEAQAPLGGQEHRGAVAGVGADAGLRGQPGLHPDAAIVSSIAQRILHFSTRARTQASCSSRVLAWRVTKAIASSASRAARGTRWRKYSSAVSSTHG